MVSRKPCAPNTNNIIAPSQCRAGRSVLGWTAAKLAKEAGLSPSTVRFFEIGGRGDPRRRGGAFASTLLAIRDALMAQGVSFEQGNGWHSVRFADRQ